MKPPAITAFRTAKKLTNKGEAMVAKEKNIAGINFAPIISYLEQLGRDPSLIFERTSLSREELTDRREYVDLPTSNIIFSTVKEIIGDSDPMIFYDIGREAARLRALDLLHDIGASLGNVEEKTSALSPDLTANSITYLT